jgi:hypothetical protein
MSDLAPRDDLVVEDDPSKEAFRTTCTDPWGFVYA